MKREKIMEFYSRRKQGERKEDGNENTRNRHAT
jgi:hypothetical protein